MHIHIVSGARGLNRQINDRIRCEIQRSRIGNIVIRLKQRRLAILDNPVGRDLECFYNEVAAVVLGVEFLQSHNRIRRLVCAIDVMGRDITHRQLARPIHPHQQFERGVSGNRCTCIKQRCDAKFRDMLQDWQG